VLRAVGVFCKHTIDVGYFVDYQLLQRNLVTWNNSDLLFLTILGIGWVILLLFFTGFTVVAAFILQNCWALSFSQIPSFSS